MKNKNILLVLNWWYFFINAVYAYVPLKPLLGAWPGWHFITGHEQTQYTEFAIFIFWCGPCFQGI